VIHLATVAGSRVEDDAVEFCSYCGKLGIGGGRVCSECGLGVRLETSAGVLQSPGAAFLVVRGDGLISAASAAAERMLGTHDVVGRPVIALLRAGELAGAVALAAAGDPGVVEISAQLPGGRGVRATVAACGFPPAALVVLERM
jgi:hypothetical protein